MEQRNVKDLLQMSISARERKDYKASYELLEQIDTTIIEEDDDKYALWMELSVTCYYVDKQDEGLRAINRLLLYPNGANKDLTRGNAVFYYKSLSHYMPSLVQHTFTTPNGEKRPTNPSIIQVQSGNFKGYLATVRTVNYVRDPVTLAFITDGVKQPLLSKTYLQLLGRDLSLLGQVEIKGYRLVHPQAQWCGIEDARLFLCNGQVWMACTFPDSNVRSITRTGLVLVGSTKHVLQKLALCERKTPYVAEKCFTLAGPHDTRMEKNWIPFVADNGTIDSLYSYEPVVFLKPNLSKCDAERKGREAPCVETERRKGKFNMSSFRGSSCPLHWGTGWLLVVHERDRQFRYTHRFVVMNAARDVVRVSVPFYFTALGIEYCAGLCYAYDGNVLVSFGVKDCEARMVSISVSDLSAFLQDHGLENF